MGSLWAITCYFNPAGFRRRLANYRVFRDRLSVPLLTVELSFGSTFELHEGDADILVQLRSPHVMWHRERLLNLALAALPDECDRVAWLDGDIVFLRNDWAARTSELLDRQPLVQPFSAIQDLGAEAGPDQLCESRFSPTGGGLAHAVAIGAATPEVLRRSRPPLRQRTRLIGVAWAARRELLCQHGLYDAGVLGGGDRAITCAAYGNFDALVDTWCLNQRRAEHYLTWAAPFFAAVQGQVGYLDGGVFHLWHGSTEHRGYWQRHEALRDFGFDPYQDISLDRNGCWRWSSDKPAMHEYVRRYFASRREDG